MRLTLFYAILGGFAPDDTPGVGTFYDFFDRPRDSSQKNLTNHIRSPRAKAKKPKNKGRKADSAETETTEELIERLSLADFFIDEQPYAALFSIFQTCFLDPSVMRGVIRSGGLTLSGDGTPAAARERGHKICGRASKGVFRRSRPQFFSRPDCGIGRDSSRNLYYSGCDLRLTTDTDGGLRPSFRSFIPPPNTIPADFAKPSSVFLTSSRLSGLPARPLILLATTIYKLCQFLSVVPFIDLNPRNAKKPSAQSKPGLTAFPSVPPD